MDSTIFSHRFAAVQQEKKKRELFTLPVIPLETTCSGQERVSTATTVGAQPYPDRNIANTHIPLKEIIFYWGFFCLFSFHLPYIFLNFNYPMSKVRFDNWMNKKSSDPWVHSFFQKDSIAG